jgi:tetratricopeptide (TPR) repeat protein
MGEVYLAHDTALDRQVALKRLPEAVAGRPDRRLRFESEAKALAALDHPNIVTVFSVEEADGIPFFTMQYVEGRTLHWAIPAHGLPLPDFLKIAIPLADAVAAAHDRGILHRDLKPANVMLTPDGRVKLLDFGLAKLREASSPDGVTRTAGGPTGEGSVVGTVAYMSPEQAEGRPLDARSDVFSLGVLLYEMATGRQPFTGDTSVKVIASILRDAPPPLTALCPELPRDVARIVSHALNKDPEHRYQTAKDLRNDLETLDADLDAGNLEGSARAVSDTADDGAAPAVSRWWARRSVLGAAAVSIVATAIGAWVWPRKTAPPSPALDPRRVVVAVFENRTGDASLDSLGRMAADWISEGLSQLESLQVVPSATVFEMSRGKPGATTSPAADPMQGLAAATGAGLVVSGALHWEGPALRVRARISDASTGRLTALEPTSGPREAPMTAIDAARQRVMGTLAARFNPTWNPHDAGAAPTYEAYQEYLDGIDLVGANDAGAIKRFKRALELDPTFIAPRMSIISRSSDSEERAGQVAILETQRGRLNPAQRQWVAVVRAHVAGRNEEALVAAREAARLEPPNTAIHFRLALYAQVAGHARESVLALSAPLDWKRVFERPGALGGFYFYNLAESLHLLAEHERELAEVRRGCTIHPDLLFLRMWEGLALAALGRTGEIDRVVDDGLALAGNHARMMFEVAVELLTHGHPEASRALARRAVTWHRDHPPPMGNEARRRVLGRTLQVAEMWHEAQTLYERAAADLPDDLEYRAALGRLAARRGDRATAGRASERLGRVERPYLLGRHTFLRAGIEAHLGEKDRAVELLRSSLAQGIWYDIDLHHDLGLQPLHGYPPYEALVKPKE